MNYKFLSLAGLIWLTALAGCINPADFMKFDLTSAYFFEENRGIEHF